MNNLGERINMTGVSGSMEVNSDLTRGPQMTAGEIWGYGFLFVSFINLSSVVGILFFPLMNKKFYANVMRVMIGLAIGSLSGSAFFHLIPKALEGVPKDNIINILLFVWLTVWIVMILENCMKIALKGQKHSHQPQSVQDSESSAMVNQKHNNNPSFQSVTSLSSSAKGDQESKMYDSMKPKSKSYQDGLDGKSSWDSPPFPVRSTLSLSKIAQETVEASKNETAETQEPEIKTVAWVIIFGDALHNFIDGISIGAAFSLDFHTGLVVCLAIICEEFPHELGDFAILINSGLSVKKALMFNFASALTCYLGLVVGILLGDIAVSQIFAVAAGIFLYVALGDMVPEITETIQEISAISKAGAWKVLFIHHMGILVGSSILYILAIYMP